MEVSNTGEHDAESRASREAHLSGRAAVGHPVDVASGAVFTVAHDFDLPGTMPLLWRRYYATDSAARTVLGPRWMTNFLMTLEVRADGWELLADNGSTIRFEKPEQPLEIGGRVVNLRSKMELLRRHDGYTIVHWHHGSADLELWHFRGVQDKLSLSAVENAAGHRVLLLYDRDNRIVSLTQEIENRTLTFGYNEQRQLKAIQLERDGGPTTLVSYTYDRSGSLQTATDAMGAVTLYTYDAEGRMLTERNPLGSTFHFRYDARGRCVEAFGDGRKDYRQLRFRTAARATDVTDSLGSVRQFLFNVAGQLLQEVSPMGVVNTYDYDGFGRLVRQANADGTFQGFEYDADGNRVAMMFEDGSIVRMGYNDRHALTSYTDALGNSWLLERNDRNQLIGIVNPLGNRFATPRDERGFVVEEVSPLGRRSVYSYGPSLSWVQVSDALGVRFRLEFDVFGNRVAYHDAEGQYEAVQYDLCNRPVEARDALGHTWSWQYNPIGEVIAYTSGAGASETAEYDSFGQLIAHHTALGVMRLVYDTEGRLTEVVNRKDERYRLFYDADGRVIREVFFDGRSEQYEWNTRDKVVRVVQADGGEVSYRYNRAAELIQIRSARGLDHRYEYDVRGLLVAASAPMSRIELAFDQTGRLVAEKQNGLTVENEYDADNFCVARRLFGAGVRFSHDARGRLSTISDDAGIFQELHWNSLDQPIERSTGAGIVERVTWRRDDLVLTQTISASGVVRAERRYGYDAGGRVATLGELNRGQFRYAYDAIGRLLKIDGSNGYGEAYSYDPIGVITRTHRGDREIGPNGRTLRDGEFAYAYDETGMLVAVSHEDGGDEHRTFDANGQLRKLTRADGVVIDYDYDALGRRVARRTGERTTRYVYTGPVLVGEQDTMTGERQFAGIEWYTLAEWRGDDRRFVVPDQTNTVREVLDSRGRVVWSGRFEAFGRVVREEGEQVDRQRFPGQFSDLETGLVYNIYRDYDSRLGAYVSPDPLGLGGGSDHYGYPRNPFLLFDPFGLRCPPHAEAAERNMGAYMNGKGYKKISTRGKPLNEPGIDGVYIAKDGIGPPLYVIAEAKSSQSGRLGNPPPSGQQMSDKWINTGTNGVPPPKDRLTRAVGGPTAQDIRNSGSVGKIVYHQPGGQGPSTVTPLTGPGSKPYAPKGKTDTF